MRDEDPRVHTLTLVRRNQKDTESMKCIGLQEVLTDTTTLPVREQGQMLTLPEATHIPGTQEIGTWVKSKNKT